MIPTLILAAGASSRMGGRDKLLEPIDGTPILSRQVMRALEVGETYVTLPTPDHPRCAIVPKGAVCVFVQGQMSQSIRAGLAAIPDAAQGVIILPGDMPDISAADIATVKTAATTTGKTVVRASTEDGKPGHPTFFSRKTFRDFSKLDGDRGAFWISENWRHDTEFVQLDGQRARLDLDTPEDWHAYRNRLKP